MSPTPTPSPAPVTDSVLELAPVLPVVVVDDPADAVPMARALVAGGLRAVEVTLRTAGALEAIRAIGAEVPEAVVGAGTVVSPETVDAAVGAGARFLVSPACTETLLVSMRASAVPFLPGVSTASEVLALLEHGVREMKFFPAEAAAWGALPEVAGGAAAPGAVLPDRRGVARQRPGLPGAAQRRLRRRFLDAPCRRGRGEGLGPGGAAGARGVRAALSGARFAPRGRGTRQVRRFPAPRPPVGDRTEEHAC